MVVTPVAHLAAHSHHPPAVCLQVMKLFAKELGIKMGDLRALMAAADENADGLIEYHEFVPLAIELLQTIYAKQRAAAEAASRAAEAAEASQAFLLYGMSQEELEATMSEVFLRADTDGSGFLDRKEFAAALRDAELGFTKKQISLLQNEADEDGDGRISYREFIPVCFGLLTEMVAKSLELNLVPQEEVALAEYLQALMAEYDVDGSGKVPLGVANAAFRDSDLGLSRLQTRALLAEANSCIDADGLVDYAAFSKVAASFINSIIGVQMDSDKAARIVAQRASGGLASVGGFDRGAFRDRLQGAFAAIDPSGSGRAHIADVRTVLREDLQFDDKQSAAIINLAREAGLAEDGSVDLAYVVEYAFDVLIQLMEVEMMHAGGF